MPLGRCCKASEQGRIWWVEKCERWSRLRSARPRTAECWARSTTWLCSLLDVRVLPRLMEAMPVIHARPPKLGNREANRLFCAWRQSPRNSANLPGDCLLQFASDTKSTTTRADLPSSLDCRETCQTVWRRGGDSNPRDPFESTRVPGVRLKPGSATSPRERDYASRGNAEPQTTRLIAPHQPD